MKVLLHYWHWKIERCNFCGCKSHWASDGRNVFCALCGKQP
jgi:hypothetical protein